MTYPEVVNLAKFYGDWITITDFFYNLFLGSVANQVKQSLVVPTMANWEMNGSIAPALKNLLVPLHPSKMQGLIDLECSYSVAIGKPMDNL